MRTVWRNVTRTGMPVLLRHIMPTPGARTAQPQASAPDASASTPGPAHASTGCMNATPIAAAGSILLLYWIATPSQATAAPRRGVSDFCRGAPDLCTVVCRTSTDCESLVSHGLSCEQRFGNLVVVEGSGESRLLITTYADSYAFCWWPTPGQQYSDLPDPATTYVPEYRGSGRDNFGCIWCDRTADRCSGRAQRFGTTCLQHFERFYDNWCEETMTRYGRPVGRRDRPMRGSAECERMLEWSSGDETDPEFHHFEARRRDCRNRLIQACTRDFRYNHPDETTENTIPLKISELGSVGLDIGFEHSAVTHWGGTRGYLSACRIAVSTATLQCAREHAECGFEADPDNSCRGRRQ